MIKNTPVARGRRLHFLFVKKAVKRFVRCMRLKLYKRFIFKMGLDAILYNTYDWNMNRVAIASIAKSNAEEGQDWEVFK